MFTVLPIIITTFVMLVALIYNCIITPHKAWYSVSAQEKLRRGAAGEVLRVLRGREPKHRVV